MNATVSLSFRPSPFGENAAGVTLTCPSVRVTSTFVTVLISVPSSPRALTRSW